MIEWGALTVHKQFLELALCCPTRSDHWQFESGALVDVEGHVIGNREPVVESIQVGFVWKVARQDFLDS